MNDLLKTFSLALLLGSISSALQAATFDSGSDGSDGALVFAPDQGEVVFDPDNYDPVLDPDRDGIYHFTTITVGSGTEVRFRGDVLGHKPLIWLASGDVMVNGDLNLSAMGDEGEIPGVGGFAGGMLYSQDLSGRGPVEDIDGQLVPVALNPFLIPLIGGVGRHIEGNWPEIVGPAGGGAMLLASSGDIFIEGYIHGASGDHLHGRGTIRIMANRVSGNGVLIDFYVGRIEAYQHDFNRFGLVGLVKTRPGPVFRNHPIKITVIDNLDVAQDKPGANKDAPDVTINNGNEVTVKVECTGIPLGATVEVYGWNDTVGEILGVIGGLTGTLEASEGTCTMIIPTGNTTFMARAVMP